MGASPHLSFNPSSWCRDRSVRSSATSSLFSRAACHADSLRCLSVASSLSALMRQNTHRAQPHSRQLRYQDRKTCGSRRPVILLDNQYSSAEHCPCLVFVEDTLSVYLYKHSVRHTISFYFLRARISRASPRGLCGTRVSSND